jgi:hypothetical protein
MRGIRVMAGVLVAAAIGIDTAGASFAAPDTQLYFGAPTRTVVDAAPVGTSVGDVTVTTGEVRRTATSKVLGYYTTNQVTVRADAPSGREIRKVDLSIVLPKGMIFATSLIRATTGVPPTQEMTFAITGGTGEYKGIQGSLTHEGVAGKPGFAVTIQAE